MDGNRSPRFRADVLGDFFAGPPWNTESPEWLALDSELGPDHPCVKWLA